MGKKVSGQAIGLNNNSICPYQNQWRKFFQENHQD